MTTCPGCEREVYADLLDDGRLRCPSCGATDAPAAFQDPPLPEEVEP